MKRYYFGEKTLYQLELNDVLVIETDDVELWTSAMRVPGGWIYRSYDRSSGFGSTCFVAFHNEFQKQEVQG